MTFNTELWNTQTPGAGGYEIERSLRFNAPDSAYLSRTPGSAGNRTTWTWSAWVKRSNLTPPGYQSLFTSTTSGSETLLYFDTSNRLNFYNYSGSFLARKITSAVFRDPSSWYHIVLTWDTTNATAADRVRIYINGVRETTFDTSTDAGSSEQSTINNTIAHMLGSYGAYANNYFDGYLAEVHFIDGLALDPSSFGEFDDNGVWQPIEYTGNIGSSGFFLSFSDNSSASALGTDDSGNGNNWTVNNISGPFYSGTALFNASLNATPFSDATGNETITNNGSITTSAAGTNSFNISNAGDFGSAGQWLAVTTVTIPANYTIDYYYKSTNATQVGNATVIDSNGEVFIRDYGSATSRSLRLNDGSATTYSYTITNNTWNHVRVTNTGIWVNGTAIHSSPINIAGRSAGITIGSYNNEDGYRFDGLIGPVRILDADLGAPIAGGEPTDSGSLPNIGTGASTGADNDSLRDSPTNGDTASDTGAGGEVPGNYVTLNPLDRQSTNGTLSNGNLDLTQSSAAWAFYRATMGVSSGKWYWEMTIGNNQYSSPVIVSSNYQMASSSGIWMNGSAEIWGYYPYDGKKYNNDSGTAYATADTSAAGSVVGMALDMDAGTLTFYKDGTSLGQAFSGLTGKTIFPGAMLYNQTNADTYNFGQRAFAYSAPSGFQPLATPFLDDPTIADGSAYMDVVTYTGDGNSTKTVSGLDFDPDLVWLKDRNRTGADWSHRLHNSVVGPDLSLSSNSTDGDRDSSAQFGGGLETFITGGFTLEAGTNDNNNANNLNTPYVAWTWDAGSSTVSNTDGSITSSVRANASAGFSIVSWSSITSKTYTIGHGLNVKPSLVIAKTRNGGDNWVVYTDVIDGSYDEFLWNTTNAKFDSGGTNFTSTVFNPYDTANSAGLNGIAYCFAPVEGYSAFGSYTGNGSSDGPFVYTGFRPRWVMMKNSTTGGTYYDWRILDVSRHPYNGGAANADFPPTLFANTSGAEVAWDNIDILSNGFKIKDSSNSLNANGSVNIYAAFAENPFKIARAR